MRRPRPKLLAVDLDGTLLDRSGKPHASDVRAIRALVRAGVPVSIVTGRLYSGTRAAAEALGLRGPVACVDGSHVVHAETHATLVHHGIRGEHARTLRDRLVRRGPATFLFAKDAIVHDAAGHAYIGYVSTWSMDVRPCESLATHPYWHDDDGITAVVAVGEPAQIHDAVEDIRAGCGDAAQVVCFPIRFVPGMWGLVARAAGGSKGSAVKWLAAHHGCTSADVVCVGDWLNDVSMFAEAGRSFAMGQAPDEVKRAATDVLAETSESGGGIARAIREAFGVVG